MGFAELVTCVRLGILNGRVHLTLVLSAFLLLLSFLSCTFLLSLPGVFFCVCVPLFLVLIFFNVVNHVFHSSFSIALSKCSFHDLRIFPDIGASC